MKRFAVLFAFLGLLTLSACGIDLSQLTAATQAPGQVPTQAPVQDATQAVMIPQVAQPGQGDAPTPDPLSQVTLSPSPTPEFPAEPSFQAMAPGQSVQFGRIIFTLVSVQLGDGQAVVNYQVQGLPDNYMPIPGQGDPALLLTDGQSVRASENSGGGGPGLEMVRLVFPSLPAGTQGFTLVIPNSWSGSPSIWNVPVRINP